MNQDEINKREWSNRDNWSGGFYFSKQDSRTWVPKAVPWMGWTINIGQKSGALLMLALLIGIPLLVVIISVLQN